jgi:hybrid cluster-associated redox disulfide protein
LRQRKDSGSAGDDHQTVMTPAQVLDALVSDVLTANPATAGVFVGHRMACVGCAFARFETVAEVAIVHGVDPRELARSLAEVLRFKRTRR